VNTRRKEKEEEKVSILPDGKHRRIEDDPSVAPINSSELINVTNLRNRCQILI
jgi:hypothetical protein